MTMSAGRTAAERSGAPHRWGTGGGIQWNVDAAWSPSFALDSGGGGLSATYFRSRNRKEPLLERIDAAIDFNWSNNKAAPKIPRDGYSVIWSGSVIPPLSGEYFRRVGALPWRPCSCHDAAGGFAERDFHFRHALPREP